MRAVALWLVLASGCASAARFHTRPEGATLYVNGLKVGHTPLAYDNEPGPPRRYHVQLVKPGYAPLDFYLDTSISWAWGYLGAFTLLPYLWAYALRGDYVFTLVPDPSQSPPAEESAPVTPPADEQRLF